jgi:hypothetical protein
VILRTDHTPPNNEDHIVCIKEIGVDLDCNFESVLVDQ